MMPIEVRCRPFGQLYDTIEEAFSAGEAEIESQRPDWNKLPIGLKLNSYYSHDKNEVCFVFETGAVVRIACDRERVHWTVSKIDASQIGTAVPNLDDLELKLGEVQDAFFWSPKATLNEFVGRELESMSTWYNDIVVIFRGREDVIFSLLDIVGTNETMLFYAPT